MFRSPVSDWTQQGMWRIRLILTREYKMPDFYVYALRSNQGKLFVSYSRTPLQSIVRHYIGEGKFSMFDPPKQILYISDKFQLVEDAVNHAKYLRQGGLRTMLVNRNFIQLSDLANLERARREEAESTRISTLFNYVPLK